LIIRIKAPGAKNEVKNQKKDGKTTTLPIFEAWLYTLIFKNS
jgi:hypothetical protein